MTEQLLREWPPGYGGVERVAHELAAVWGGVVWSFDAQGFSAVEADALAVTYPRRRLPCTPPVARVRIPLPSPALWQLLCSKEPLHGHLPSPGVLLVLALVRLLRPRRRVTAHWHFFLETNAGLSGLINACYQRLALLVVSRLSGVVTTSPLLREELLRCGCRPDRVAVLSCCLSADQESGALALPERPETSEQPLRVLFIGRLDSYKRLDWLMQALSTLSFPWRLMVVGDGPRRRTFENLSRDLFASQADQLVQFCGRLDEKAKLAQLAAADVLVLPSDRSHEAFGIVQLEAMAAGIPALAFQRRRSGMGWVGQLPGLTWPQTPEALPAVLQRLAADPALRRCLGRQARQRYEELFARRVWLNKLITLR